MRLGYLVTAFIVALGVAALADAGEDTRTQAGIPLIVQGLDENPAELSAAAIQGVRLAFPDANAIPAAFGPGGQRFTCEQIRVMDEVELITDDSYCE